MATPQRTRPRAQPPSAASSRCRFGDCPVSRFKEPAEIGRIAKPQRLGHLGDLHAGIVDQAPAPRRRAGRGGALAGFARLRGEPPNSPVAGDADERPRSTPLSSGLRRCSSTACRKLSTIVRGSGCALVEHRARMRQSAIRNTARRWTTASCAPGWSCLASSSIRPKRVGDPPRPFGGSLAPTIVCASAERNCVAFGPTGMARPDPNFPTPRAMRRATPPRNSASPCGRPAARRCRAQQWASHPARLDEPAARLSRKARCRVPGTSIRFAPGNCAAAALRHPQALDDGTGPRSPAFWWRPVSILSSLRYHLKEYNSLSKKSIHLPRSGVTQPCAFSNRQPVAEETRQAARQ